MLDASSPRPPTPVHHFYQQNCTAILDLSESVQTNVSKYISYLYYPLILPIVLLGFPSGFCHDVFKHDFERISLSATRTVYAANRNVPDVITVTILDEK